MNTKTMEGLVGARTNMELLNTPFRVYKEARLKGDTAVMERSMGYVNEYSDKAEEYSAEADKGMKEDAKEAREKAELEREQAIRKRKEERDKFEEKVEENRSESRDGDTVEVSAEGKKRLEESVKTTQLDSVQGDLEGSSSEKIGSEISEGSVVQVSVGKKE